MKSARVKTIKNNIAVGTPIPNFTEDCQAGQYFDQQMAMKGHNVDTAGTIDLPDYGVDNKTRKSSSKASHTIGSMTISDIIATPVWEQTRFYQKSKNQNRIEYNTDFMEVTKVFLLDMDIDLIQEKLSDDYRDLRQQLVVGNRSKEIKIANGWAVLDGYGHSKSYRMRITYTAMKKIENISGSRDTVKKLLEFK